MDFWIDGKSMGGTFLADQLTVALIRAEDGHFDSLTVDAPREAGVPDFMFWTLHYVARGGERPGEATGVFYDTETSMRGTNSMPIRFAAPDSVWTAGTAAAADPDHRVVCDTTTGRLYYDADGNGAGSEAVWFAVPTASPALASSDFVIADRALSVSSLPQCSNRASSRRCRSPSRDNGR